MRNRRLINMLAAVLLTVMPASNWLAVARYSQPKASGIERGITVDDSDVIVESAKEAVASLTALAKSKAAAIKKRNELLQTRLSSLKTIVTKLESSLANVNTRLLASEAAKNRDVATSAALSFKQTMEDSRQLISDSQAISAALLSINVFTLISTDRARVASIIDLMKKRNVSDLANLLKRNTSATDLEIVDLKSEAEFTLRIRIGSVRSCLSTKRNCDGQAFSAIDDTGFRLAASELSSQLEGLAAKLKRVSDQTSAIADKLAAVDQIDLEQLQSVLSDVSEVVERVSSIAARLHALADTIIGNLRG